MQFKHAIKTYAIQTTMQLKLLQKIEELTLYVIELDEKNEILEEKNKQLDERIEGIVLQTSENK